jgi:cytochrome c oxidase cbb3-type subunit 2
MPSNDMRRSGGQGIALVAITYVYFLIFAQFAFLRRLADSGIAGGYLKPVMAAMAIGGILLSLLAPRVRRWPSPRLRLRVALVACSAAALASLFALRLDCFLADSFLIGAGLGLLTVTLVTNLRLWIGSRHPLLNVALGTGVGYFICNFPPLFSASPQAQSCAAAGLCLIGLFLPLSAEALNDEGPIQQKNSVPFLRALACFTALVWLDSAAFFIIQNTPSLKAGTWQGSNHLWANGILHLLAALTCAWLLRRRGLSIVLTAAVLTLGFACLLLLNPGGVLLASIFYPIGVSLYSVALVAYPSLLAPASSLAERGRQAGWIYAIAGWAGSALGIGMSQNLGLVPPAFVAAAGAIVLFEGPRRLLNQRRRELIVTAAVLLAALAVYFVLPSQGNTVQLSQIARGRQVYISEGCINCHSQYVRPNTADVLMWGPAQTISEVRSQRPPLIGNRRQGPDLAEVGARRSPGWLKAHFYNPAEVSGTSIMPSYGFLFSDGRGDDLVAYLASLNDGGSHQHDNAIRQWRPAAAAAAEADADSGGQLFHLHCVTCHDAGGRTRLQALFPRVPPDLRTGPFAYLPPSSEAQQRLDRLAQIAKFGIPGTDMPGHEYLSDKDIASISLWLSQNTAQSSPNK